jgi:hypothetical protein
VRDAIWPVVEELVAARVAAARAETAEQIKQRFAEEFPTSLYGDEVIISRAAFEAIVDG